MGGGIAVFVYGVMYYFTRLLVQTYEATLVYFGTMFVVSVWFAVLNGCLGHYACMWFFRKLFMHSASSPNGSLGDREGV